VQGAFGLGVPALGAYWLARTLAAVSSRPLSGAARVRGAALLPPPYGSWSLTHRGNRLRPRLRPRRGRSPTNARSCTPFSAAIISAAFSPIMIAGAFVLPLVMLGMTLASATRNLPTPRTRSRGSTTSPSKLKGRTFRMTFQLPADEKPRSSKTHRLSRLYRNPIILAQEWQQALSNGGHATQAEFARRQGICRARVTQVLQLLNLTPDALNAIAALGDPLCSGRITNEG
jgi:hypothetical protein